MKGEEQIGQEMLENLSHDREKIQRARERLRETDANLGKSSRILTGMLRSFTKKAINFDCERSTAKEKQDHSEFAADRLMLLWDKTKIEEEFIPLGSM
ncbi:hypothetical protein BTVI_147223 [Pitangus sulphuratus]|nr:hypothetical protein BTVI_147223 [Pitangus sulphuratus]